MSIASELTNLEGNIEDSYDAVNDMGGIIPAQKNMDNLDQAIRTIPQSTGPTPGDGTLTIQKNGTTVATFTANQSTNTTANISVQENSTMFYGKADTLPGEAGLVIYNNATRTTQTTWQQFADALQAGPVSITFDGDVLDHPYPIAVIYSEVYGGSISFIVESAGASYIYTWDDTDTEPGTPTIRRYQPLLTAGSNISISSNTISATDTTYSNFTGATSSVAGANGLVPAPAAGDNTKCLKGDGTWASVFDMIYPVGSIYMSVNNTDPGTLFGGTWAQIQDSFILAAGSTYAGGSTGGAATINLSHSHTVNSHNHSLPANTGSHTLTVEEIPSHSHNYPLLDVGDTSTPKSDGVAWQRRTYWNYVNSSSVGGGKGHTHSIGGNTGDKSPGTDSKLSSTQSILPPYLAVYVWKRTA